MATDQLEVVYEAESAPEASIIESLLKANQVDCTTRTVGLPGVLGASGAKNPAAEQIQILVKASELNKAEQVILDYQSPDDAE